MTIRLMFLECMASAVIWGRNLEVNSAIHKKTEMALQTHI